MHSRNSVVGLRTHTSSRTEVCQGTQPKGGEAEESHESGAAGGAGGAGGSAAADEARKAKLEALTSERRQYGYVGKAKAKPAAAATETK